MVGQFDWRPARICIANYGLDRLAGRLFGLAWRGGLIALFYVYQRQADMIFVAANQKRKGGGIAQHFD